MQQRIRLQKNVKKGEDTRGRKPDGGQDRRNLGVNEGANDEKGENQIRGRAK